MDHRYAIDCHSRLVLRQQDEQVEAEEQHSIADCHGLQTARHHLSVHLTLHDLEEGSARIRGRMTNKGQDRRRLARPVATSNRAKDKERAKGRGQLRRRRVTCGTLPTQLPPTQTFPVSLDLQCHCPSMLPQQSSSSRSTHR